MIHDIARGAVIRKTQKNVNIMTGNYEAAFAIGLLSKICNVSVDAACQDVSVMKEELFAQLGDFTSEQERVNTLIQMLRNYKPSTLWDEDVLAMYERGLAEDPQILSKETFFH